MSPVTAHVETVLLVSWLSRREIHAGFLFLALEQWPKMDAPNFEDVNLEPKASDSTEQSEDAIDHSAICDGCGQVRFSDFLLPACVTSLFRLSSGSVIVVRSALIGIIAQDV